MYKVRRTFGTHRSWPICISWPAGACSTSGHIWELPGNYPVFTVVMVIYLIIWIITVTPNFWYSIYDNEKYYLDEPFNKHIQSLINIIQENNWVITTITG